MGVEDGVRDPIFEVDGVPVLDYKLLDLGNTVTFQFTVEADEPPTPGTISFSSLMNEAGAWSFLEQKGWVSCADNDVKAKVLMDQRRECEIDGAGTYKLSFSYSLRQHN